MATPFSRTLRSIRSDGFGLASAGALAALVLLAVWATWFVRARVDVLVTCAGARVALESTLYSIEAPVAGRVAHSALGLGREVRAGEVLVELDTGALELEASEERTRAASAQAELAALEAQRALERGAVERRAAVAAAVREEERIRRASLALDLELARSEVVRLERLAADGIVSELDLERARGVVRQGELALELHGASEARRGREEERSQGETEARLAALERELERQRGLLAAAEAHLARLTHALDEHHIRAPRDGTLAEVRALAPGSGVQAGERLAALAASGALGVVADFPPADALGRIAVGQRARLRLDGFPWSRHGTLGLTVARVGGEPHEGRVRVEFTLDPTGSAIPLQHGLPGVVEVVVERVSPAELVLQHAGLALARAGQAVGTSAAPER